MKSINQVLQEISQLPEDWHQAGTVSINVLHAMARHLGRLTISNSMETGSGKSTLLFSHISPNHKVFSVDAGNSISKVRNSPLFNGAGVEFIEGPTQITLTSHVFRQNLQAAFIDGPHGYPFPDMEYYRIYPYLDVGALLIIDDIHIPTIHNLFEFLREDEMFELLEVVETTAFFSRTSAPLFAINEDGWWLQNYNKNRFPFPTESTDQKKLDEIWLLEKDDLARKIADIESEIVRLKAVLQRIQSTRVYKVLRKFGRWEWLVVEE
jgi:hypothetical protein